MFPWGASPKPRTGAKTTQEECRGAENDVKCISGDQLATNLSDRDSARSRVAFALVQLLVGRFQKILRGTAVVGIDADADAHGERRLYATASQRRLHAAGNLAGHSRVGIDQQHGKLVASVARSKISGSALLLHHFR